MTYTRINGNVRIRTQNERRIRYAKELAIGLPDNTRTRALIARALDNKFKVKHV